MSARKDPRNGGWFARVMVPGTKTRLYVTPEKYGLPNTRVGAEEAERRAINAALNETPAIRNANTQPEPPMQAAPAAPAAKEVPTLEKYGDEIWLAAAEVDNKPATLRAKRTFLNVVKATFGTVRLDAIDQRSVDAWRIELSKKYAPASTNQMLKALSSILRNAVEHGLIATRPKIKRVKVPVRPVSFFIYDEADRLVAACDDDVRTMVVVALKTGLRIGELTAAALGERRPRRRDAARS